MSMQECGRVGRAWRAAMLGYALAALAGGAHAHGAAAHEAADGAKRRIVKEQKPWGIAGDEKAVTRTIEVGMGDDMRFHPDRIRVKRGETVRFTLHNTGKVLHEMVIGTRKELEAHAALMMKFPDMEHSEPYMAHVPPGRTGEIVWTFNRPGQFDFACLVAGHFQAGMRGRIEVTKPSTSNLERTQQ